MVTTMAESRELHLAEVASTLCRGRCNLVRIRDGYNVYCPAHDDNKTPSLTIRIGKNGKLIYKCPAGCTQEAIPAALQRLGILPTVSQPGPVAGLDEIEAAAASCQWRGQHPWSLIQFAISEGADFNDVARAIADLDEQRARDLGTRGAAWSQLSGGDLVDISGFGELERGGALRGSPPFQHFWTKCPEVDRFPGRLNVEERWS
jgi:hypothetical protein